jgi:hypothetical protein
LGFASQAAVSSAARSMVSGANDGCWDTAHAPVVG